MAQVIFDKVNKSFGDTQVLFDINLTIHSGELVVLLGPSGCGKTTLLRLIAGLEKANSGRIYIGERLVNDVDPKDRDIAMVFQNYAIYPHLTARRNMDFGLRIRRIPKLKRLSLVDRTAGLVGLLDLLERKPRQLSGGQRQRVAMGRAMVREPSVFLLDEPLSNLDAKLRNQVRVEIKELQRRLNKTMVYVTHDQSEAMTLADRMVVMDHGRIEQVGSPLEVYLNPANTMVAGFIGVPAMNLIGAAKSNGAVYRLPGGPNLNLSQLDEPPGELTLGVRPEHLLLLDEGRVPSDNEIVFETRVYLCENHGAETLLNCRVEEQILVARMPGVRRVREGAPVRLAVNLEQIHLFDSSGVWRGRAGAAPGRFRRVVGA